jgi:quercetin dioxygenase-like cupin family protein
MRVSNAKHALNTKIEVYPYKDTKYVVKDVWVRWLSQAGPEDNPEYGLRFFTVGPQGEIPIHKHFFYQTMYILTGSLLVYSYDSDTDEKNQEMTAGPNDVVFIPSMEPHSAYNPSDTEECTFLCCIANVYEEED